MIIALNMSYENANSDAELELAYYYFKFGNNILLLLHACWCTLSHLQSAES